MLPSVFSRVCPAAMSPSVPKLFTPVTLGGKNPIVLQHRIAMAPLTRVRANYEGVPPDYAAKYYKQRSTEGGLIISEATNITPYGRGYVGTPGIYDQDQIDGWKRVTDAVHAEGSVIFMQIWQVGRLGHPDLEPGNVLPVSSSTNMPLNRNRIAITLKGQKPLVKPRALETHEIPKICEDYRIAAENAIAAGFDGVEVHAANGFFLEQFLFDGINDRTDKYGGSIENRARFLFEVLDAILKTTPSSKVGVRLSPYGMSCGQQESNPAAMYSYVFDKLNDYDLAYAHLIEPRGYHYDNPLAPAEGATAFFRKIYKGVLITSSGYDRESAIEVVKKGDADLVAIGRDFISNPDLVKRFKLNAHIAPYDPRTLYYPGERGYTDYPTLEEEKAAGGWH